MSDRIWAAGIGRPSSFLRAFAALAAALVWAVSASAQSIPSDLASLTGNFWPEVKDKVTTDVDASPARKKAVERTRKSIEDLRVRYFPKNPPRGKGQARALATALGLDFDNPADQKELTKFLKLTSAVAESVLSKRLEGDALQAAIKALKSARTLNAKDTSWSQKTENGEEMTIEWDPETGQYRMTLYDNTKEERFQTSLTGQTTVDIDPETGDLVTTLTPDETPMDVLTEADFVEIERNIWGEWVDNDGLIWIFVAQRADAAGEAEDEPSAMELRSELADLETRKARVSTAKEYVWFDPTTDTVLRQEKFRRLGEPWEFRGEEPLVENADAKIAEMDARIAEIRGILTGSSALPVEQDDPVSFVQSAEEGAIPISIYTTLPDGWRYDFPEANFDGRTIRGRRTKTDVRDGFNSVLPPVIVEELIASWSPPEWIEVSAKIEPGTRKLTLEGGHWGLHVTYKSFFGGTPTVSSTHTPFSEPKVMTRDAATDVGKTFDSAMGAADTDLP